MQLFKATAPLNMLFLVVTCMFQPLRSASKTVALSAMLNIPAVSSTAPTSHPPTPSPSNDEAWANIHPMLCTAATSQPLRSASNDEAR